jgi:uncharacterized protein (TIGR00255 family)
MTAYASLSRAGDAGQLTWEVKSVNQRYLDASLRLPEDFRVLEPEIRARLKNRFSRGKFDVTLRYHGDDSAGRFGPANAERAAGPGPARPAPRTGAPGRRTSRPPTWSA